MSTEVVAPEGVAVEVPEVPKTLEEFREEFPQAPKRNGPAPKEAAPNAEKAPRHRAKSQQAGTDDTAAIAAETRRLREAEAAIGITRKEGESERVYQLRARAEIAELAQAAKAAPAPKPAERAAAPAPVPSAPVAATAFTEAAPIPQQFTGTDDPYGNYVSAKTRWELRKETFEQQQTAQRTHAETAQREAQATFARDINAGVEAHVKRIGAFIASNADAKALFEAEAAKPQIDQIGLPLALRGAIEFSEEGPQFMVALLKDPALADELFDLTNGRAIGDPRTDPLVARVRRKLLQRVQAVSAGSAAPLRQTIVAPRPPNPARTVPQTPRSVAPPDAPVGSLAEHRQRFPTRH